MARTRPALRMLLAAAAVLAAAQALVLLASLPGPRGNDITDAIAEAAGTASALLSLSYGG